MLSLKVLIEKRTRRKGLASNFRKKRFSFPCKKRQKRGSGGVISISKFYLHPGWRSWLKGKFTFLIRKIYTNVLIMVRDSCRYAKEEGNPLGNADCQPLGKYEMENYNKLCTKLPRWQDVTLLSFFTFYSMSGKVSGDLIILYILFHSQAQN